jgi:hypothetical protein
VFSHFHFWEVCDVWAADSSNLFLGLGTRALRSAAASSSSVSERQTSTRKVGGQLFRVLPLQFRAWLSCLTVRTAAKELVSVCSKLLF